MVQRLLELGLIMDKAGQGLWPLGDKLDLGGTVGHAFDPDLDTTEFDRRDLNRGDVGGGGRCLRAAAHQHLDRFYDRLGDLGSG